jgi:hypothetical protein
MFTSKKNEVTGGGEKLYNEELHNLCSSLNIIKVASERRMRWSCHVACM